MLLGRITYARESNKHGVWRILRNFPIPGASSWSELWNIKFKVLSGTVGKVGLFDPECWLNRHKPDMDSCDDENCTMRGEIV